MKRGTIRILPAFAISSILGLAFCLVSSAPVLAEAQHAPSTPAEADKHIATFLNKIEAALAENHTIPPEANEMLISAWMLLPAASPEGRRLMREFPEWLKQRADEQHSAGEINKSNTLKIFAIVAALYGENRSAEQELAKFASAATPPALPKPQPAPGGPEAPPEPPKTVTVLAKQEIAAPEPAKMLQPTLPASVQRTLLERGDAMLKLGDVSAARMLFARAAEAGIGMAALKLANTYDPVFLTERNLRGIKPDLVQAETWYRKAVELGETQAQQRLKSLEGRRLADVLPRQ